jgi:hypothetical protein
MWASQRSRYWSTVSLAGSSAKPWLRRASRVGQGGLGLGAGGVAAQGLEPAPAVGAAG